MVNVKVSVNPCRKVKKKDKKSFGKFSISSDKFSIFYSDIQKTPISSGISLLLQKASKAAF